MTSIAIDGGSAQAALRQSRTRRLPARCLLSHGFARVRCQACADEILVAFSWKRRGIGPSCTARRMADPAAHLVADLKKLAASSALAQAIYPAQPDLEKCLPQLLATNKTPADWIRWFRQLNLVGAMRAQVLAAVGGAWHEALAELIDAVQPVLDAQPAVRDILCGRGVVTSACLETAFADGGRAIAFVRRVFGTETLRGLVKAAIEKLAATDQLKTTKAAARRLRLAVATIKRCSGPSCTASQVEGYLEHPEQYWPVDTTLPASLCWDNGVYVKAPAQVAELQRLVILPAGRRRHPKAIVAPSIVPPDTTT